MHKSTDLDLAAYPKEFALYRVYRLYEEGRDLPQKEILLADLRVHANVPADVSDDDFLSLLTAPMPMKRDGRWRQSSAMHRYRASEEPLVQPDRARPLARLLRYISPRERSILLYSGRGVSHKEIAEKFGISRQRVGQVIERALEKIRKKINEMSLIPPSVLDHM